MYFVEKCDFNHIFISYRVLYLFEWYFKVPFIFKGVIDIKVALTFIIPIDDAHQGCKEPS
jgi:hypothetical protein